MRNVCRFFLEGKCKYGAKCKYEHVQYSGLVDPPQWIYSCYGGLDMTEISPEEARFALMCGDMKETLDNFWIGNYMVLCSEMDFLEAEARVESLTNRYADMRMNPDVFMAPFDVDRVLGMIGKMREEKMRSGQRKQGEARRGEVRWTGNSPAMGGLGTHSAYDREYRGKEQMHSQQGIEAGGSSTFNRSASMFNRNARYGDKAGMSMHEDKSSRGFTKEPYVRGNDYLQKEMPWGYGKGIPKKNVGGHDEFDMQDVPSSFGGRHGEQEHRMGVHGWESNGATHGGMHVHNGKQDDSEFIEEDFEYGKVPYSYRRSSK